MQQMELIEKILSEDNLNEAIKKVKSNKVSNVKLFKDSLVKIIGDVFDCYDLIINLFGGQCQII